MDIGILPEEGLPQDFENGRDALGDLFLGQLQESPFMNELEVSSSERVRQEAQRHLAGTNLASASDESSGLVTQTSAALVSATRVSELALKHVSVYMERLAWWVQCCLQRAEGLNLSPSELVADFVRDMHGNYYFVQLKGFQITPLAKQRVHKWYRLKQRRDNLEDDDHYDAKPRHTSGPLAGLTQMDLLNPALMTRLKVSGTGKWASANRWYCRALLLLI